MPRFANWIQAAIFASLTLLVGAPLTIGAQAKWTEVGTTSAGNKVSVDSRTIRRTGPRVSATVRVIFSTPVQTPTGPWASSQTKATFDCAKQSLAAKENVFFADARGRKVTQRTVNKIPGYGPALKGSLGEVALTYLCRT